MGAIMQLVVLLSVCTLGFQGGGGARWEWKPLAWLCWPISHLCNFGFAKITGTLGPGKWSSSLSSTLATCRSSHWAIQCQEEV